MSLQEPEQKSLNPMTILQLTEFPVQVLLEVRQVFLDTRQTEEQKLTDGQEKEYQRDAGLQAAQQVLEKHGYHPVNCQVLWGVLEDLNNALEASRSELATMRQFLDGGQNTPLSTVNHAALLVAAGAISGSNKERVTKENLLTRILGANDVCEKMAGVIHGAEGNRPNIGFNAEKGRAMIEAFPFDEETKRALLLILVDLEAIIRPQLAVLEAYQRTLHDGDVYEPIASRELTRFIADALSRRKLVDGELDVEKLPTAQQLRDVAHSGLW